MGVRTADAEPMCGVASSQPPGLSPVAGAAGSIWQRLTAIIESPLRRAQLIGPRRSWIRRLAVVALVCGIAGWLVGWRVYGWQQLLSGKQSLAANHCPEALKHFGNALLIWPDDPGIELLAAQAARRSENFERADYYLKKCQGAPALAESAALERVLLRASQGEVDAVADFCYRLLSQDHPDAPLILEALAVGNLKLLRFAQADQALDRWLQIAPDQPQATYLKGRLQLQASNNQEALSLLNRAIELDASRDDARLLLAGLYLDLGQAQEALPHLEIVCRREPQNFAAKARMAQALVLLGRPEEAIPLLDELIRQQPNLEPALLERGKLALRDGDLDQAEELLQRACKRDIGDRAAHYQFLQCLKRLGKTKEARAIQERLDQIDRDAARMREIVTMELPQQRFDANLQAELGELLLNVGADSEGLSWLNRALQVDPGQPRAHSALARHYEALGQSGKAQQHRALAERSDATPEVD